MPPATYSSFNAQSNTVRDTTLLHIGVIIGIVAGVLAVFGTTTVLLVWFVRNRRAAMPHRTPEHYIHKRFLSDPVVAAPLLPNSNQFWGFQDDLGDGGSALASSSPNGKVQELYSPLGLQEEKPLEEYVPITPRAPLPMGSGTTVDLQKPNLSRLTISPSPRSSSTSTLNAIPHDNHMPSPVTADSDSLYSQPSAEDGMVSRPVITAVPGEEAQPPTRVNTFVIRRMLKERADRNPQPLSRSVSRIERQGSIQSFLQEEPSLATLPRSVKKRKSGPVAPMTPLPEAPPSPTFTSTSTTRTIRQDQGSFDAQSLSGPLLPPSIPLRDTSSSPAPSSPSTGHLIRQFPFPPTAPGAPGPSSPRMPTTPHQHVRPPQLVNLPSVSSGSGSNLSSQSEVRWGSVTEQHQAEPHTVRTMKLSHKAEVITLDRRGSILPSVYPYVPHAQQVRRDTIERRHLESRPRELTPPLKVESKTRRTTKSSPSH